MPGEKQGPGARVWEQKAPAGSAWGAPAGAHGDKREEASVRPVDQHGKTTGADDLFLAFVVAG